MHRLETTSLKLRLMEAELQPPHVYEAERQRRLEQVLLSKRMRRVDLGPNITVVFENLETLSFHLHEILRAEEAWDRPIGRYHTEQIAELIPMGGELSATLLFSGLGANGDEPRWQGSLYLDLGIAQVPFLPRDPHEAPAAIEFAQVWLDAPLASQLKQGRASLVWRESGARSSLEVPLGIDACHELYADWLGMVSLMAAE